ncbi:MAG: hypothetical protein Q4G46_10710 [Propionibacteriaceae bacterium]|nr:hypothetical protein [Propionibacteriaceae bacterium]
MTDWDLLSRPVGTQQFVYHGVGTLTRVSGLMNDQLDRLVTHADPTHRAAIERVRGELGRRVTAFRSGKQTAAWCPDVAGKEFCLARHVPTLFAVIERRSESEHDQPVPPDMPVNWFTRVTHDGWQFWTYVWETGRFHLNPHVFNGLYGDEARLEMVPITLTEFRSRLARGQQDTLKAAFGWASAPVDRCAPELLLDGPLPAPRF